MYELLLAERVGGFPPPPEYSIGLPIAKAQRSLFDFKSQILACLAVIPFAFKSNVITVRYAGLEFVMKRGTSRHARSEASRQVALVLGGKQSEYVVDLDQLD